MKLIDMHCHTSFSEDSEAPILHMCESALQKGLKGIAFTEHVDFNPADKGYGYFDAMAYQRGIEEMRLKFGSSLKILKGMEFSEPHLYPKQYDEMIQRDWDVVIGSVHMIGSSFVGDYPVNSNDSLEKLNKKYFDLMLHMVTAGGFDILAHMDFPKRYFGKSERPEDLIDEILKILVNKKIALEINTSPKRKGLDEFSPDRSILERYASFGGERICLGSDAHKPEDISADFDTALQICRSIDNLKLGYFNKREFFEIPL